MAGKKRMNLVKFRGNQAMTQAQMANVCGVTMLTYSMVERCKRRGSDAFWKKLQEAFNIPDEDMWKLMQEQEVE